MSICPYCAAAIAAEAAERSAAATSIVSQACSDASYLKVMTWSLLSFFVLMLVPFLSLIGVAGLWFLRFAIPVMAVRWWIKFGSLKTSDADFAKAKLQAIVTSILGILALTSAFFR